MLSKGEIASCVQEDGQIKVETTPGTDIARLDGALTQPATLPLLTKASQLFVPADPKRSYMNSAMMATVGTHATVGGLWLLLKQYVPFTPGTTLLGAVAGVPQRWRGNGDKFLPLPLQNLDKLLEAPSSDGLRQLIKDSPLLRRSSPTGRSQGLLLALVFLLCEEQLIGSRDRSLGDIGGARRGDKIGQFGDALLRRFVRIYVLESGQKTAAFSPSNLFLAAPHHASSESHFLPVGHIGLNAHIEF